MEGGENLLAYSPLWGATFDSQAAGLIGESVMVYTPSPDEWRQVQKTEVWKERSRQEQTAHGPAPPVCAVAIAPVHSGEPFSAAFRRLGDSMHGQLRDAVLALRLLKGGWFLDPELCECTFRLGPFNHRAVGPYRQAFTGGTPPLPSAGYRLLPEELTNSQDSDGAATRVWELVRSYRNGKPHASADIAMVNFQRSYGYTLSATQRLACLFTGLDAVLGGMSARDIADVPLRSRFRERVAAGLAAAAGVRLQEEAGWLDSSGRRLRNALAHGRPLQVAEEAGRSWERIQSSLRVLVRQYLEFSVRWAVGRDEIRRRFSLPAECPPVAAYNKLLEAAAHGMAEAAGMLSLEISGSMTP